MKKNFSYLLLCFLCFAFAKAQLSFCSGEAGAPIFTEDFGTGTTNGPPLPAGVTTYQYVAAGPQDGQYTISSTSGELGSWWDFPDHTGNANGKMLIVNADFNAGQFYRTPINGLCENTSYEFSAWIMNVLDKVQDVCGTTEIPIQVRFEIWDSTDTTLLAAGDMNPRFAEVRPTWIQYGLTFTTSAGQNGVILKMINVGNGGCGNDLAIDDIVFRPCGDLTDVVDNNGDNLFTRCVDDPATSITLNASPSVSVFTSPEYQWQTSTNNSNYTDIPGATGATYTTPVLTSTTYYRLKVAEDAVNLNNSQCVNFSEVFEYRVVDVPLAIPRENPYIACDGELIDMIVDIAPGTEAYWYDAPIGGNLVNNNSIDYTTNVAGFYYVETIDIESGCVSTSRVEVELTLRSTSPVNSEDFVLCPGEQAVLDTELPNATYDWSIPAPPTQSITVNGAGLYTCVVTNSEGCESIATFNVSFVEIPVIDDLVVVGDELTVVLANTTGNFRYSIDGFNYQDSPVFNIEGLIQVDVRVRDEANCEIVFGQFNRISIPQFFTPNNDGYNDTFEIDNIESFPGARMEIFDRHGKLLQQINNLVVGWDGLYNNQPMPSSDYWYKLYYNNQVISGHFTLKR